MEKKAYSANEFASLMSVSKAHVHRLINTGVIRTIKLGRRVLIPASELDRLISEQTDNVVEKEGDK